MTLETIKRKHRAWKQAKDEAWKRAWEFADAVAEYAKEKPRGYGMEIAAKTGLTSKYVNQIKRTAVAYALLSARNPEASFRAHMQFVMDGRGGEWVPDGTTLRDVNPPERSLEATLQEAPLEQIEQIISGLSKDRQQAIGAAAGNEYLKARQSYDETERNLTPAERSEREAASEAMTQKVREATGGFLSLGIAGHLEQATEELHELVADSSITAESLQIVLAADKDWSNELQVAVAMAGLEHERIEV